MDFHKLSIKVMLKCFSFFEGGGRYLFLRVFGRKIFRLGAITRINSQRLTRNLEGKWNEWISRDDEFLEPVERLGAYVVKK